jgi:hypothetical protein
MKIQYHKIFLIIFLLFSCKDEPTNVELPTEETEEPVVLNPKILSPNSSTVWKHWMYDREITTEEIIIDSTEFYLVLLDSQTVELTTEKLDENTIQILKPVNPIWGAGSEFKILAIKNLDSTFSQTFTIEKILPPTYDVAKVLTFGTVYYYAKKNESSISLQREEVIGDTLIDNKIYAIFNYPLKPFERSDSTKVYFHISSREYVLFDLEKRGEGIDYNNEMPILGFNLPGMSVIIDKSEPLVNVYNKQHSEYTKLFGQVFYDHQNPQWAFNRRWLVAAMIDGIVYGDTTWIGD